MPTETQSTDRFENIKVEKDGSGITFLTLNRPRQRNAMSPALHNEMAEALDELAIDDETRVLVLTGAGEAFCAGQDLKLFFRANDGNPAARFKARQASHSWRWEKLSKFPKPTIAMVNGYCFGGAFTQVCACDFVITSEEATYGLSEVNWGIIPGGIVSWNVAKVMSYRDALYYACTGDTFDGKEAVAMRFANRAVPLENLRDETVKFAKKLMAKNPTALRFTKEAIRAVREMDLPQAADYLAAKSDALKYVDPEKGRQEAMKQFIDEKSFRPGLGNYERRAKDPA